MRKRQPEKGKDQNKRQRSNIQQNRSRTYQTYVQQPVAPTTVTTNASSPHPSTFPNPSISKGKHKGKGKSFVKGKRSFQQPPSTGLLGKGSVKDRAYDSVHANCTDKQLEDTLTFARVIKFYTHRCFQLYPQFQLDDLQHDKKDFNNNAMTIRNHAYEKGKGRDTCKGKGRGRDRSQNPNRNRSHPPRNSETRQKGKGKGRFPKANPHQQIVPQAIANQKNHAAIAVVQTTPHAPATRDRTTKRMRRARPHINRQTSIYRLMKLPICFKTLS
jgi:hypothetical protein